MSLRLQSGKDYLAITRQVYDSAESNGDVTTVGEYTGIREDVFEIYAKVFVDKSSIISKKARRHFWGEDGFRWENVKSEIVHNGVVTFEEFVEFVGILIKAARDFQRINWGDGGFFWEWTRGRHEKEKGGERKFDKDVLADEGDADLIASHMLKCAVTGHQLKVSGFSKVQWLLYDIGYSVQWSLLRWVAIFTHCALLFGEAPAYEAPDTTVETVIQNLQFFFVGIYWVDILLRMSSLGISSYLSLHVVKRFESNARHKERLRTKYTNRVTLLIVCALTADAVMATLGVHVGYLRVLRPMLFVCNDRKTRQMIYSVWKSMPNVLFVFMVLGAFIFAFACIGLQLFVVQRTRNLYGVPYSYNLTSVDATTGLNVTEVVYAESSTSIDDNFDNIFNALLTMFVLFTTENFPTVMWPALKATKYDAAFFVGFLIITVVILLQTLLALFLDAYRTESTRRIVGSKRRQTNLILGAYQVLATNVSYIKETEGIRRSLTTDITPVKKKSLHKHHSSSRADTILGRRPPPAMAIPRERVQTLRNHLQRLNVVSPAFDLDEHLPADVQEITMEHFLRLGFGVEQEFNNGGLLRSFLTVFCCCLPRRWLAGQNRSNKVEPITTEDSDRSQTLQSMLPSMSGKKVVTWRTRGQAIIKGGPFMIIEGFFVFLNAVAMGSFYRNMSESLVSWLDALSFVSQAAFMILLIVKAVVTGCRAYFVRASHKFELVFEIVLMMSLVLLELVNNNLVHIGSTKTVLFVFRLARSLQLMRIIKFLIRFERLKPILETFFRIRYAVARLLLLLLVFMYIYAVIGMGLFANRAKWSATYTADDPEPDYITDFDYNFQSFFWSMLALFQIFVQNNWNDIMRRGMSAAGGWTAVYFISFYVLVTILLSNLIIAVQWEVFGAESQHAREQQEAHEKSRMQRHKDAILHGKDVLPTPRTARGTTAREIDPQFKPGIMVEDLRPTNWEEMLLESNEYKVKVRENQIELIEELSLERCSTMYVNYPRKLLELSTRLTDVAERLEHEVARHIEGAEGHSHVVTGDVVLKLGELTDTLQEAEHMVETIARVHDTTFKRDIVAVANPVRVIRDWTPIGQSVNEVQMETMVEEEYAPPVRRTVY